MERFLLALSFIVTGWIPLFFGIYLSYLEQYFIAVTCFLVSFCGFRQVHDTLKHNELYKNLEKKINNQQAETARLLDQKNREIQRLRGYYD